MEEIPGSMGSSCGLFSGKSGIAHHLFIALLLLFFYACSVIAARQAGEISVSILLQIYFNVAEIHLGINL
ncbi:MAG: hypothetical protein DRP02_07780 [Candidatus Gerdarchaeota archaeon]|nr:MAG: hypothetical protein DRP02_07780 [Candidatus Gerdarchaeota archaeon]